MKRSIFMVFFLLVGLVNFVSADEDIGVFANLFFSFLPVVCRMFGQTDGSTLHWTEHRDMELTWNHR